MSSPIGDPPVALITGGSRGIGRALVEHLVQRGFRVGATARTAASVESVVAAAAGAVLGLPGDATDSGAVVDAVAQMSEWAGVPDLVIANAGVFREAGPLAATDVDAWWDDVTVNLRGPMLLARHALPPMLARGSGRLVLMSSGIGNGPSPWGTAYGASKAALTALGGSLAAELDGTGVGVFVVSPGFVKTDMTRWPPRFLEYREDLRDQPDSVFRDVGDIAALIDAISAGTLDQWRGRFLHAGDDIAALTAAHPNKAARQLSLAPFGPTDWLAGR